MMVESKYHQSIEQLRDESLLVDEARKNPKKFSALYNKYYVQVFQFIYHRMDDKQHAADTTQQVFLKALVNLKKYESRGVPFSSWLYRIAMNEINQLFRQKKAQPTINIESNRIYDIIAELDEDSLEKYHDQLIKEISYLQDDEVQLLQLRFFEKRAFREIGDIINITENNAKVRTYRLLDKLKESLMRVKE